MKKILFGITVVASMFTFATIVSASGKQANIEVLSELANVSEEVIAEKKSDMSFGDIAQEYEVYEQFKEERTQNKIAFIELKVEEGKLTSEEASEIIQGLGDCNGSGLQLRLGGGNKNGNGNGKRGIR